MTFPLTLSFLGCICKAGPKDLDWLVAIQPAHFGTLSFGQ